MDVKKTNNANGDFANCDMYINKDCTVGKILDDLVNSYYAKGLDYYTANMLAIKDLVEHITFIHKAANDLLKYVKGSKQNG